MNSIGNDWDSTKRAKNRTYFDCGLSCQNESEAKGKTRKKKNKKSMRMDKSKKNTLRYVHMYIYAHP